MITLREEGLRSFLRKAYRYLQRDVNTRQSAVSNGQGSCSVDVLFVNGCDSSVPHPGRYRVRHQIEQLSFWGFACKEEFYLDAIPEDADCAETIILFRCPYTNAVEQLIARAHDQGKKVLFDIDDLVIHTSYTDDLPVVRAMSDEDKALFDDGVMRNGRTLLLCDEAIVSTERLKTELEKFVPKVFVNRNVASMEMFRCSYAALANRKESRGSEVRIGYFSGSMTHNEDFEQVLPALVKVMDARPGTMLVVMGDMVLPAPLQRFAERVEHLQKVDWRDLPAAIASVDICIAPIKDTLFNEAKSENKWTEASLVKVPTAASDVGAFHDVIEDGKTGFLCKDDSGWSKALFALVDDPTLRKEMGQRAYDQCVRNGVTATTGYKLALWLSGKSPSIDEIVPTETCAREFWMEAFSPGACAFDSVPSLASAPWEQVGIAGRIESVARAKAEGRNVALFVYERLCGDAATFRYFGYNVVQRLGSSKKWSGQYFFVDEMEAILELLPQVSCLVMVRARFRPEFVVLSQTAAERSVPVVYAMDDNALGRARAPRIIEAMATDVDNQFEIDFWTGVTRRFELAASLADCFIASSSYFADVLREQYRKPAFVVHPSLNDEQVAVSECILKEMGLSKHQGSLFTLGYFSGTASHQKDFSLIEGAVIEHLNAHEDSRLLIVGCFQLSDALYELLDKGKVIVLPKVDYATLQTLQASVDVVLAPLVLDEFSHCKGALKVFEAGAVRTPACASPSFSYCEAIENGVSGFLCETADDWVQAFEVLHGDASLRQSMGDAAYSLAMGRYYGEHVLGEIERALDGVVLSEILERDERTMQIIEGHAHVKDWDDPFAVNPMFAHQ